MDSNDDFLLRSPDKDGQDQVNMSQPHGSAGDVQVIAPINTAFRGFTKLIHQLDGDFNIELPQYAKQSMTSFGHTALQSYN